MLSIWYSCLFLHCANVYSAFNQLRRRTLFKEAHFSADLLPVTPRCASRGYRTFQRTGRPKAREGARFLLVTLAAIVCNDLIVWLMSKILLPVHLNPTLWTNSSKVAAIGGTILVSYLGMRLWVFVQSSGSVSHQSACRKHYLDRCQRRQDQDA